jgi:hypothetical protein
MSAAEVDSWVPESCTLPSVEQPVRLAEFDAFFAETVRSADRLAPDRLRLLLDPAAQTAARAADLMVRETACCSFFTFSLIVTGGEVVLEAQVPAGQSAVLDALAARAIAGIPA